MMNKLKTTLFLILLHTVVFTQNISVSGHKFNIVHSDLTFYLDNDTCSVLSIHRVTYKKMLTIDGDRSNKWHKEKPYGPYNKNLYKKTGYDLGHLTPSNMTSYNDTINYHSFSLFNQAPQLAAFNRGKWSQLEKKVLKDLLKRKCDAIIITGVIYDKNSKMLANSRIKIPLSFFKIVITKSTIECWMGSNMNGEIVSTDLKTIMEVSKQNGNSLVILIKN